MFFALIENFVFARYENDIEGFGQFIWRMLVIYVQTTRRQSAVAMAAARILVVWLPNENTNKRFRCSSQ